MIIDIQEETIVELQEKALSLKKKQCSADQSWSQQFTKFQSTMNQLSQQDIKLHASIENHTWRKMFTKFISFKNEHKFFFLILTQFNTHYESMRDSIYCNERCASVALFSYLLSLFFAFYTVTVFNARTL